MVDVDSLSVPRELILAELTEPACRAALGEYLCHLEIRPRDGFVAIYTDSVPPGDPAVADSSITVASLLELQCRRGYCYGLEVGDPRRLAPGLIEVLQQKFRVGGGTGVHDGPLQGVVIVESTAYQRFQTWFLQVIRFLLEHSRWREYTGAPDGVATRAHGDDTGASALVRHAPAFRRLLESCVAYYFGQTYGEKLVGVGGLLSERVPDAALKAIVECVAGSKFVVLAFSNKRYLRVLRNWIVAMKRSGVGNFLIIALDEKTRKECARLRVACYKITVDGSNHKQLMRARVRIFRDLTKMRVDFVSSDLDAVWLRDPLPYLESLEGDLLVSQGTVQPPEILKQWGFVLCSGFFASRASEKMRIFYDMMIEDDRGDQISMSHMLLRDNIKFDVAKSYTKTFRDHEISCFRDPVRGRSDNFQVVLLPHHLFQRMVEDTQGAMVVHPLSKKDQADKLRSFRKHGCYFL